MADALQLLCLDTLADHDLPVPPTPDGHPPGPTGPDRSGPTGDATGGGASAAGDPPGSSGPDRPKAAAADRPGGADSESDGDRVDDDTDPDKEPTLFGGSAPAAEATGPESQGSTATATSTATPTAKKPPKRHRRAPAQIHFHCDVTAWLCGHPEGDELCQIPGLGPVPLSMVKAFQHDAVLKLVLRDGENITAITSHRRYIPAALRTALEARDHECVAPGCHVTRGLQVDHVHDFAKDGPTALWNNAFLCVYHHYLKTHCGWILRGPPGHWTFTPPDTS